MNLDRVALADMLRSHCCQAPSLAGELCSAGIEILDDVVTNQVLMAIGN